MKIITVATDLNNFFLRKFLVPSCEYFGYDLVILYTNQSWKSHRIKDELLIPYLKQLESNEVILFTDAYDTMMLNDQNHTLDMYHQFDSPFIFSSEANCFPEENFKTLYNKIDCEANRYLNSGGFICRSNEFLKILGNQSLKSKNILKDLNFNKNDIDYYENMYEWSNQYLWTLRYLHQYPNIDIDKNSKIFYTTGTPMKDFKDRYLEFVKFGEESNIYKNEKLRINNILNSLKENNISHFHFFNAITNHILKKKFITNSLPQWIDHIVNYKKLTEKTQVIEF